MSDQATGAAPLLSVIVPTHDTRELTTRCFAALAATRVPSCELLLVDDASSDGTAEAIARLHPDVRVLRLTDGPHGFTAAANAGLEAARGEILWLLNSDTEVEPGAAAALVAAFAARPWVGVAGAELLTPAGDPAWSGGRAPAPFWLLVLGSGLAALLAHLPGYRRVKHPGARGGEVDWVSGAALAIRRAAWRRAGPLDARFRFYAQDVDLCLRVRDLGWQVVIAPGVRVVHHEGGTIGRARGAVAGRWEPSLLWTDLVRVVAKRSGARAARRARRALVLGATLRVLLRRLATVLVAAPARDAWRADTRALARGLAALHALDQRALVDGGPAAAPPPAARA